MGLIQYLRCQYIPFAGFVIKMSGPWISGKESGNYVVNNPLQSGDVIEVDLTDNPGCTGKSLPFVQRGAAVEQIFVCDFLAASDKKYQDFFFKDEGHDNPGLFKTYAADGDDRFKTYKKKIIHIYKYRCLFSRGSKERLDECTWLKGRNLTRVQATLKDLLDDLPPETDEQEHAAPEPVTKKACVKPVKDTNPTGAEPRSENIGIVKHLTEQRGSIRVDPKIDRLRNIYKG